MPQSSTPEPLTDEQLAAIRERATAATSGPWGYHFQDDLVEVVTGMTTRPFGVSYTQRIASMDVEYVYDDENHDEWDDEDVEAQTKANADFIAHARADIPALLADVARLRARVAELVERDDALFDLAVGDTAEVSTELVEQRHTDVAALMAETERRIHLIDQDDPDTERCAAAHSDDPTPCDGGPHDAVWVFDAQGRGTSGCEHHGARMLASLRGGRVYPGPAGIDGGAIRVFTAAQALLPFPWMHEGGEGR